MSTNLPEISLSNRTQRLYRRLLAFSASLLACALVVIQNNTARTIPIFMFLLFFGVGMMLALGVSRGILIGLFMISIWIATKQFLGVWQNIRLLDYLMELLLTGLTFIFAGRYHDSLQKFLRVYQEHELQLKQLDLEDKTIGLLKPSIGLLRLSEEEERSVRYRRPFALILIMVRSIPGRDAPSAQMPELVRSVAAAIKDTTRETDIPFLASTDKIAVILPETETSGANKVVNNILNRMMTTQFIDRSGRPGFIHTCVQLRFGFAAFLGASPTKINMMEAAEASLQRTLEINNDDLFQNLFIEWKTVGEVPLATPLLEKMVS